MKIVATTHLLGIETSKLSMYDLVIPEGDYFTKEELETVVADAEVLISTYDYPISSDLLKKAGKLRLVANFGVGYNNVDVEYCRANGILVTNTPQPVIEPTAEHCFALMHAIAHRTAELDRKLREANTKIRFGVMRNLGVSLYNKQLGIVGMGRIGQALARRAKACGMSVVYHNRHRLDEAIEARYEARYVEMDELLKTSDYVSLNLPYTPEVRHLIDAEALGKMRKSAILVNTARGAHVDERALVAALQNGVIAGAALDVYEEEPVISKELLQMDNVVLSPHIGTGTVDGRLDMLRNVEENVLYYAARQPERMNLV